MKRETNVYTVCNYCGDPCLDDVISINGTNYCCYGCATLDDVVSKITTSEDQVRVEYKQFDLAEIFNQLVDFQNEKIYKVSVVLPSIHCSSCVELLEDLPTFNASILSSDVNFEQRRCTIVAKKELKLSFLAQLLDDIGYPPQLSLGIKQKEESKRNAKTALFKMAVAGFCFGNIMLYSMPHYLGLDILADPFFSRLFSVLSIVLTIPVVFYSGKEYLSSAYKALMASKTHINIPIAIGMLSLMIWSIYEIVSGTGPGYLDSLAGLVFFLLVGKWFQSKIYDQVSFQRSLSEFIPMVVRKKTASHEFDWTTVGELQKGDIVFIKNNEIIPVNGILRSTKSLIDYSFITGEQIPEEIICGKEVYTGGRHLGAEIEIQIKEVPDTTKLWSNWSLGNKRIYPTSWTNKISKYFTLAVLAIALIAGLVWFNIDASRVAFVCCAVLIVACPCALALSAPFTYGNILRVFSKNNFFVKEAESIQFLADIDHIVFDKTGTLTEANKGSISYLGENLSPEELSTLAAITNSSTHPLSQRINTSITAKPISLESFEEYPGKGVFGSYRSVYMRLGSASWLGQEDLEDTSKVGIEVNGQFKGYFSLQPEYRTGSEVVLNQLGQEYNISVLSGDNDAEKTQLLNLYEGFDALSFNMSPSDKQDYIEQLKNKQHVAMIGDGLNDASALESSNFGIAVTESLNGFYPGSDAVLIASEFRLVPKFMELTKYSRTVLRIGLVFSLFYNLIGISFAVTGMLTPILAAILMPLSSVTVVSLDTMLVRLKAKKLELL